MLWTEKEVLNKYKKKLLKLKNVEGVGIGYKVKDGVKIDEIATVIFVKEKLPVSQLKARDIVPEELDGVRTDVIQSGRFRLLSFMEKPGIQRNADIERTRKIRPAPGGVSIGHYEISAGTLGTIVRDNKTGKPLILSNNHVLANLSTTKNARAKIGDSIVQPGPYDNGEVGDDTIARLIRYVPLETTETGITCPYANFFEYLLNLLFQLIGKPRYRVKFVKQGEENLIDAALAEPIKEDWVEDRILEIGKVNGTVEPELGMAVKKSGRTTGVTEGQITAVGSTVKVDMGHSEQGIFANQVITTPLSRGGDSGSLIVDNQNRAVGLLFAGSDNNTVFNPIQTILELLDIDI